MNLYSIGNWGFVNWLGQSPRLVNEHMRLFTKPGQPGISGQLLGVFGDPFEVELHAAFPNQDTLILAENGYRYMITAGAVNVVYNAISYLQTFSHLYLVVNVTITRQQRVVRTFSSLPNSYDYPGGWLLESRWQLVPIVPGV